MQRYAIQVCYIEVDDEGSPLLDAVPEYVNLTYYVSTDTGTAEGYCNSALAMLNDDMGYDTWCEPRIPEEDE